MGKSLFIVLAVCIMYSGVRGGSESMSCSTVNGRTICNKQTSQGNAAMASSSSFSSPDGSSQQTYAGAGTSDQWDSSQQRTSTGNGGPSPSNDYFDFDRAEFQGAPRRFDEPVSRGGSYSSSSSAGNFGADAGPMPVVGGFGFASAGNIVRPQYRNFVPGTTNTPQDFPEPNGSGSPANNNFRNDNSRFQVATGGFGGSPVSNNFRNDNSRFQVSTGVFGGPPISNNFRNDNSRLQVSTGGFGRPPVNNNFRNDNSRFQVPAGGFGGLPVSNNFRNDNSRFQVPTGGFGELPVSNNFRNDNSRFQVPTGRYGELPVSNNFRNDNSRSQVPTGRYGGLSVSNNFPNDNSRFQVSTGVFGGPLASNNFRNDNSRFQVSRAEFGGPPATNNLRNDNSRFQVSTGGFAGGPSVGGMSYSYSSSGSAPNFGTNEAPRPTASVFGFATAGNSFSPGFPSSYVPGFVNRPQQDSSRPNGGGSPGGMPGFYPGAFAGGFAGAGQPFNPFQFVFGGR